ncbi:hypothetical protein ACFQNE_02620 [Gordonia phosphorivorans]|uniref:Uncharacterized protein n=1 Tax=Gordonia phosphorivorans TaxID=1056982 RepID=A0ABV6H4D1_9ACTN
MPAILVTRYRLVETTTVVDVPDGFDPSNSEHRDVLIDTVEAIEGDGDAVSSHLTIEPAPQNHHSDGRVDDDEIVVDDTDAAPPTTWGTWTYLGHWDNSSLVIDSVHDGDIVDTRPDDGTWEEGLFADAVSAPTIEDGRQLLIEEYVNTDD